MKRYCVVYLICGIHYRYRCYTNSENKAKNLCIEYIKCKRKDIVDVYIDE